MSSTCLSRADDLSNDCQICKYAFARRCFMDLETFNVLCSSFVLVGFSRQHHVADVSSVPNMLPC